jgi:DNA-binding transcriptional LysR family regulator
MDWEDLRFAAAAARHGSLLRAARELGVKHTTVGRRIDAAERELGAKLFARSTTGLVLTAEGARLLEPLKRVEEAVSSVERQASAARRAISGTVKVTAPETFGVAWLAPRLASFAAQYPGLRIDLDPSGQVLDLGRQEAEIAVRFFRSKQTGLFVRRAAEVTLGLYASRAYLSRHPLRSARDLATRPLLGVPPGSIEATWLTKLAGGARPIFTSMVTLALVGAAKADAGIAVLPRYLGDAEPELAHLPMPDAPREVLWLTVHRDLRSTPRIRAVLEFLVKQLEREAQALRGR